MGRTIILRAAAVCAVLASLPMLALGEDVAQRKERRTILPTWSHQPRALLR